MRRIGMAVLSLGLIAGPLLGQRSALREVRDRGAFGADFVVAQPLGEFRRNGDVAGGLSIFGVTSGGALALRIDASWMAYDAQYQSDGVTTTSQIGTIGAGPQRTPSHDAGGYARLSDRGVDRDSVISPAVPDLTLTPSSLSGEGGPFSGSDSNNDRVRLENHV